MKLRVPKISRGRIDTFQEVIDSEVYFCHYLVDMSDRLRCLSCKCSDLRCNNRKSFSCLSRARRLYGSIECKKVCLT